MYEVKQQRFSPLSVRGGSQSREILYHVGTWPMHTCISTRGAGVTRPVSIGGGTLRRARTGSEKEQQCLCKEIAGTQPHSCAKHLVDSSRETFIFSCHLVWQDPSFQRPHGSGERGLSKRCSGSNSCCDLSPAVHFQQHQHLTYLSFSIEIVRHSRRRPVASKCRRRVRGGNFVYPYSKRPRRATGLVARADMRVEPQSQR